MTTKQAARNELARIGDTRYHINQAAAEGRVLRSEAPTWQMNGLERAGELFQAGFWTESRKAAVKARGQ